MGAIPLGGAGFTSGVTGGTGSGGSLSGGIGGIAGLSAPAASGMRTVGGSTGGTGGMVTGGATGTGTGSVPLAGMTGADIGTGSGFRSITATAGGGVGAGVEGACVHVVSVVCFSSGAVARTKLYQPPVITLPETTAIAASRHHRLRSIVIGLPLIPLPRGRGSLRRSSFLGNALAQPNIAIRLTGGPPNSAQSISTGLYSI